MQEISTKNLRPIRPRQNKATQKKNPHIISNTKLVSTGVMQEEQIFMSEYSHGIKIKFNAEKLTQPPNLPIQCRSKNPRFSTNSRTAVRKKKKKNNNNNPSFSRQTNTEILTTQKLTQGFCYAAEKLTNQQKRGMRT
jgi:hypothetical protein